jgi:hypothetical protein
MHWLSLGWGEQVSQSFGGTVNAARVAHDGDRYGCRQEDDRDSCHPRRENHCQSQCGEASHQGREELGHDTRKPDDPRDVHHLLTLEGR